MLKHLHIRNLATIDELELDFAPGFTALTGETGAGKSILIDAISLITGMRADSTLVRNGEEKAEVSADFQITSSSATAAWLEQAELQDSDDLQHCMIRRVIYAEGRTRAFVNGNPVNAGQLRELSNTLIEIFGQSESQTLLHQEIQRQSLDEYGGYAELLREVAEIFDQHRAIERRIQTINDSSDRSPAQIEYLRAQIQELAALGLQEGELEKLESEHRRLSNAGRYLQEGTQAVDMLYGDDTAIYTQMSKVAALLSGLTTLDGHFNEALELVENAQSYVREAANHLSKLLDRMDLDPAQLAEIEQRLGTLHDVARKHRVKPRELEALFVQLKSEYVGLESSAGDLQELSARLEKISGRYRTLADDLHQKRTVAAEKFSRAVTGIVRELGMPNAVFLVRVDRADENLRPQRFGSDTLQFLFSANPGMPPKPLAKIASGGELSRISLAMQVIGHQDQGVGTMIFDEVDAGIGGATAEIVGQKLRMLGKNAQVLCVTHLAQVAAQSNQHFGIRKQVKAGKTFTQVAHLQDTARVEEIARMQGGIELTASALDHARDLLKRATR